MHVLPLPPSVFGKWWVASVMLRVLPGKSRRHHFNACDPFVRRSRSRDSVLSAHSSLPLPCPSNRQHYRRDLGCVRVCGETATFALLLPCGVSGCVEMTRPPNRLLWSRELPQARRGPNPRAVAYGERNGPPSVARAVNARPSLRYRGASKGILLSRCASSEGWWSVSGSHRPEILPARETTTLSSPTPRK